MGLAWDENARPEVETPIQDLTPISTSSAPPRAQGSATLSVKKRGNKTVIGHLHQQGSLKLLFPRSPGADLTAVTLNTAGGITGGDRFDLRMNAQSGTRLTVTTQAAERAYRTSSGAGQIRTDLSVEPEADLAWLPQETLLYNQSSLHRQLNVALADGASCLLVESLIFGRAAMGETVHQLDLDDRITLHRDGRILFADRTRILGDAADMLTRAAIGRGAGAMASILYVKSGAADMLTAVRDKLPCTAGASAPTEDVLFSRILSSDGFGLRSVLIPLIELLRRGPLPRPWMI